MAIRWPPVYPQPDDTEEYRRAFPGPPRVANPPELTAPSPDVSAAPPPEIAPPSVMTGPIGATPPPVIARPSAPPPSPPPPVATPEQDRLRQMIAAGPRTSKLGMIAGGLVRAGAAYANSNNPSRPIAHVNNEVLGDWAKRSPTGGPWREGMQRQSQLAGLEAGDQQREVARQKQATDASHTQAQIDLSKQQGAAATMNAETSRRSEEARLAKEKDDQGRLRDTENRNIGVAGGRELAPGEKPDRKSVV